MHSRVVHRSRASQRDSCWLVIHHISKRSVLQRFAAGAKCREKRMACKKESKGQNMCRQCSQQHALHHVCSVQYNARKEPNTYVKNGIIYYPLYINSRGAKDVIYGCLCRFATNRWYNQCEPARICVFIVKGTPLNVCSIDGFAKCSLWHVQ